MTIFTSYLFRLIPIMMGVFTCSYGLFIQLWLSNSSELAGDVLISFTSICIALYTTAATIIRQLINHYNNFYRVALPLLGYACGVVTSVSGGILAWHKTNGAAITAGNIIFGIGLIAICVSTVAATSTKFGEIAHSDKLGRGVPNPNRFSRLTTAALLAVPSLCAGIALLRGIFLITNSQLVYHVSGHVLVGIAFVCASLIWLVYIIATQINNTFKIEHKWTWAWLVLLNGLINIGYGTMIVISPASPKSIAPGWVLIGLGLVCWSISSKVILLTLVWRHDSLIAKRTPLIPVFTCLGCLFISIFLFEISLQNANYYIPAHVLAGLGAVCFTIYSIVSILESGTESPD